MRRTRSRGDKDDDGGDGAEYKPTTPKSISRRSIGSIRRGVRDRRPSTRNAPLPSMALSMENESPKPKKRKPSSDASIKKRNSMR
jgi:hypothetical protein